MFRCKAEEYYKNDYPDEESSEYDTSEGSGTSSHTYSFFFFPLEAATLAHLQTSSMTTLTIMTTTIGAKALPILPETGLFCRKRFVWPGSRASRIALHFV
jgi:hypothetical protein